MQSRISQRIRALGLWAVSPRESVAHAVVLDESGKGEDPDDNTEFSELF